MPLSLQALLYSQDYLAPRQKPGLVANVSNPRAMEVEKSDL